MKRPGVRIRMKLDFVFDTEDPKAIIEWVDTNEFIAAGLRAAGYRKGRIEAGAKCSMNIATKRRPKVKP